MTEQITNVLSIFKFEEGLQAAINISSCRWSEITKSDIKTKSYFLKLTLKLMSLMNTVKPRIEALAQLEALAQIEAQGFFQNLGLVSD